MALRIPAKRLLVRCPNWVGDAVMSMPTLRCLRRNYPSAEITLLLRPYVRPVYEHAPYVDDVVEIEGSIRTVRRLRKRKFDLAVLLVHSFHSAMLVRAIGARRRVGYSRGDQGLLLSDPLSYERKGLKWALIPKVDLYAHITEYLGCKGWQDKRQELFHSWAERKTMQGLLKRKGADPARPLICLCPGAAYGASKYWVSDRFAEVADALCDRLNAHCVVIASPDEFAAVEEIRAAMVNPLLSFEEGEMDLGLLKPLVAASSLMVTTDTGPRHYAVALDVPVAVLMGPTDPRKTDSDYDKTVILRQEVPCGPCYKRECPKDHRCMEQITAQDVLGACDSLLERTPAQPWGDKIAALDEANGEY